MHFGGWSAHAPDSKKQQVLLWFSAIQNGLLCNSLWENFGFRAHWKRETFHATTSSSQTVQHQMATFLKSTAPGIEVTACHNQT